MLIRAVVAARLFGIRLLTLDAQVVVADSHLIEPAFDALVEVDRSVVPVARRSAPVRQGVGASRHDFTGGVGHARELLAQGTDTLAGLRRPGQ